MSSSFSVLDLSSAPWNTAASGPLRTLSPPFKERNQIIKGLCISEKKKKSMLLSALITGQHLLFHKMNEAQVQNQGSLEKQRAL